MKKKAKKRVNISIDDKLFKKFKKRCVDLNLNVSERIEILMKLDNKKGEDERETNND